MTQADLRNLMGRKELDDAGEDMLSQAEAPNMTAGNNGRDFRRRLATYFAALLQETNHGRSRWRTMRGRVSYVAWRNVEEGGN